MEFLLSILLVYIVGFIIYGGLFFLLCKQAPIECDECKVLFKEKENTINGIIVCPKCKYSFQRFESNGN